MTARRVVTLLLATLLPGCHPTPVCEPAAQRCDGTRALTCSTTGVWEETVACPSGSVCAEVPQDALGPAGVACVEVAP